MLSAGKREQQHIIQGFNANVLLHMSVHGCSAVTLSQFGQLACLFLAIGQLCMLCAYINSIQATQMKDVAYFPYSMNTQDAPSHVWIVS